MFKAGEAFCQRVRPYSPLVDSKSIFLSFRNPVLEESEYIKHRGVCKKYLENILRSGPNLTRVDIQTSLRRTWFLDICSIDFFCPGRWTGLSMPRRPRTLSFFHLHMKRGRDCCSPYSVSVSLRVLIFRNLTPSCRTSKKERNGSSCFRSVKRKYSTGPKERSNDSNLYFWRCADVALNSSSWRSNLRGD